MPDKYIRLVKDMYHQCETEERRAGVGTGAVEGSLGNERNESVKDKDRVGPTCV